LLGVEPDGLENVFYSRKVNTSSYFNSVSEMFISKAACTSGETSPSGFEQPSKTSISKTACTSGETSPSGFEQPSETSPEA
jgi:hypothetical protein